MSLHDKCVFLDPRRTAGSIAIMCGFHLLLTYLDCRSVHLSEILVVCGDCLGKYVYIEFFSKLGFNVRISGHLKTLRLKRRCKLVENLRIAGHFLNKSVGNLMC